MKETVDEDGNLFFIGEEEKIYLRKRDTREDRCLGKVMVGEKNLLYHKFEDESNIFRKTNAWSINYTIFEQVDHIVYETLKFIYVIPKVRAAEFGEVLKFSGTERKIYIPIMYWDKRRVLIDPIEQRRRNLFGDSWYELLKDVINSPFMAQIGNYLRTRRTEAIVYPEEYAVFRALKMTHFKQTKVVILGQDPYYDGSANGLAFGYKGDSNKLPNKSLDVIFKEVERDLYNGFHLNFDNTLDEWAKQGVLLLNTILTVERGKPKSHEGLGWQRFVKILLYELMIDPEPKVFMAWGTDANELIDEVIDKVKPVTATNLLLRARHPAADLYAVNDFGSTAPNYPVTFAGCKHFSQANEFLKRVKRKQITW